MEELWPGGIKYEGAGAFPVTTDSLLLADFARMRRGSRVLELGCAAGLISLLLLWREPELELSAVELDGAAAETALRNFAANGFAATVICGDLRARGEPARAQQLRRRRLQPAVFRPGTRGALPPPRLGALGGGVQLFGRRGGRRVLPAAGRALLFYPPRRAARGDFRRAGHGAALPEAAALRPAPRGEGAGALSLRGGAPGAAWAEGRAAARALWRGRRAGGGI